jgi:hypothetical protein
MSTGQYDGGIWLEGSPSVDETTYWLNLLIDTTAPLCGNSSQRPHGAISNDGDRNIMDSVDYILSGIWKDEQGRDTLGGVLILDEMIFASRDTQKGDARPGGYVTTGGHGGVLGSIGQPGPPILTYRPARQHTFTSQVRISLLPRGVPGVRLADGRASVTDVRVKDGSGDLLPPAIPAVTFVKSGRYQPESSGGDAASEVDLLARLERNLAEAPLAGFVADLPVRLRPEPYRQQGAPATDGRHAEAGRLAACRRPRRADCGRGGSDQSEAGRVPGDFQHALTSLW